MARILVIDDSKVILTLVQDILQLEGHRIICMEDGESALSFASRESVDLVLTDHHMPNMKGTALISKLRRQASYTNTPILMLTSETDANVKRLARTNGADGWVQKPIESKRLFAAVNKMLAKVPRSPAPVKAKSRLTVAQKLASPKMAEVTGQYAKQFWHKDMNKKVSVIHQGHLHICVGDEVIYTMLGSCIAVCIRDTTLNFGGMNHFLLPSGKSISRDMVTSDAARYGEWSMEILLNGMFKAGAKKQFLEAKVYGGGQIVSGTTANIGIQNIAFIHHFLEKEKIPIIDKDTGGNYSRKVYFSPGTGEVKLTNISCDKDDELAAKELAYMAQLDKKPVAGSIDLF